MTSSKKLKSAVIVVLSWILAGAIVITAIITIIFSKSEGAEISDSSSQEILSPWGTTLVKKNTFTGVSLTERKQRIINLDEQKLLIRCQEYIIDRREFFGNRIRIKMIVNDVFLSFEGIVSKGIYQINRVEKLGVLLSKEEDPIFIERLQEEFEEGINSDLNFFLNLVN